MKIVFIAGPYILKLYKLSDDGYKTTLSVITILAIICTFKTINCIIIVGILRSGGDTKFSLIMDAGSVWLIGVPMAILGAFVLKLPVTDVFIMVSLEEAVKLIFGLPRVKTGKWIKDLVKHL